MFCDFSQYHQTNAGTDIWNRTDTGKPCPSLSLSLSHTHTHTMRLTFTKTLIILFQCYKNLIWNILRLNVTDGEHVGISCSALHNLSHDFKCLDNTQFLTLDAKVKENQIYAQYGNIEYIKFSSVIEVHYNLKHHFIVNKELQAELRKPTFLLQRFLVVYICCYYCYYFVFSRRTFNLRTDFVRIKLVGYKYHIKYCIVAMFLTTDM
jgi:hypothetical protein